jgi:hypothetical protein
MGIYKKDNYRNLQRLLDSYIKWAIWNPSIIHSWIELRSPPLICLMSQKVQCLI